MPQAPHILVVDDDAEIRDLVASLLKRNQYRVETARDGREMRARLEEGRFQLILLDIMMPGEDGLTLCRSVRAKSNVPIIMLTAVGETVDRIVGLEMGADDYLPKPFDPRELLARIKAVLRRHEAPGEALSAVDGEKLRKFEGWSLDLAARSLTNPDGVEIDLTAGEFDLLAALVERPNRVLSRDQLLDLIKGREAVLFDRSIDAQVSRLRRKIETDPANPRLIKTVRSGGYMFTGKLA